MNTSKEIEKAGMAFRMFLDRTVDAVSPGQRCAVLTFMMQDLLSLIQLEIDDKEVWVAYVREQLRELGLFVDEL